MPREKSRPDSELLDLALELMREKGPEALTFAALAQRSGLSASTLVQRFGTKPAMTKAALIQAWDRLSEATSAAIETAPRTPQGAIDLLVALSGDYGGIEAYADSLLVLREDIRDPDLRGRGKVWGDTLSDAIEACFADSPGAPNGIGQLMACQWQGALLWWSFDPATDVVSHVATCLGQFVDSVHPGSKRQ